MELNNITLAKVTAVHPGDNSVDLMRLDTGAILQRVQAMGSIANTTNTGTADIPDPTPVPTDEQPQMSKDRDLIVVLMMLGSLPVVMGALKPQVCQLLFEAHNFRVQRHASDVYTTVDAEGNVELYHPSGTFLRIGITPDHKDLTGEDADKKWKISKNTDTKPYVRLVVANGGKTQADLEMDPNGNVSLIATGKLTGTITGDVGLTTQGDATLQASGKITAQAGGDIDVTAGGAATVKAATKITADAPETACTGSLTVAGDIACSGSISDVTGSMSQMRTVYNGHTQTDSAGDSVGPPAQQM